MIEYRAEWVVPISGAPVRHGSVLVDDSRVRAVVPSHTVDRGAGPRMTSVDLGRVAVMPGLVNAHTHLELSWLRGRIPRVRSFPDWIRHIIRARRERANGEEAADHESIDAAIGEARRFGTILIGDISNTLITFERFVASAMRCVVFKELVGFNPTDPDALVDAAHVDIERLSTTPRQRATLAAHAPYSVSPELFRRISARVGRTPASVTSVHLAESVEEIQFLHSGLGPWHDLLEDMRAWNGAWTPPNCGPVQYLERLGFLGPRVLVVHGVQLDREGLVRLAHANATLVTCPRGNINTAAGRPPVAEFFGSGVRVALGTDSLASVDDLNLFEELAALRRLAPHVPASALLRAATVNGAMALGFGDELGTIEPGRSAELLAVRVPVGVEDVEEYLVSGIDSSRIQWINQ